jgi:protein gp37
MGKTLIEWCDYTFNIWKGCWKISPGCENCYAEAMDAWLAKGKHWGRTAPRHVFKPEHYRQPFKWNAKAQREGKRFKAFCGSVMDIAEIHPVPEIAAIQDKLRAELYAMILATPYLDWLLLSKRPENFGRVLPRGWVNFGAPSNLWLGATVENHKYALERYPMLMGTRAGKHFFSYEPALGPIDWDELFQIEIHGTVSRPDLVIFGDESGRKKRPAEAQWARDTRDACERAGVTYFFKQWCGADAPGIAGERDKKGKIHLPVLDGRQHSEMP